MEIQRSFLRASIALLSNAINMDLWKYGYVENCKSLFEHNLKVREAKSYHKLKHLHAVGGEGEVHLA